MNLDKGDDSFKSCMGSICSIIFGIGLFAFAMAKFNVLLTKKDVDVAASSVDDYFEDSFKFSNKDHNLFLAAAITDYPGEPGAVTEQP